MTNRNIFGFNTIFLAFAFLFVLSFTSCTQGGPTRSLDELITPSLEEGSPQQYQVHKGDTLLVKVWGEPQVSGEVYVRKDGRFTLPLVNDIDAEGKSLKEVADEVKFKLKKFIPTASVSVSVAQTASTRYYLSGAFVKPGVYSAEREITFLQAVATGGGFAPFANESNVVLIRKTKEGDLRYKLDYNRVIDGKEPNPELKDGDFIAVQ